MDKVRWGIISTAKIGREKVIPAMQKGSFCRIDAIASRDLHRAQEIAGLLKIPKVYGTYEELLNDPDIDAIYIPLPNHMHVEWAIKSIEAGKHVLCEKPLGLSVEEINKLREVSLKNPSLKIMEAFMYRFHPQWQHVKKLVDEGGVGELKMVQSFFSYYNDDPANIRNRKEAGGGGLMDIGCYCISFARYLFNREPKRVLGTMVFDPVTQTDILTSAILDFSSGSSAFTCSTRLTPYQRVNILGSEARIEIEIPVNAPPDKPVRIWIHDNTGTEEIVFDPADQYTLQGDAFSKAILNNTAVPTPLEDAINNMKVIEAIFEEVKSQK